MHAAIILCFTIALFLLLADAGTSADAQADLIRPPLVRVADAPYFDFIVCNPPYVSDLKPDTVQRQVREHEPKIAVFSGASGLEIYQRLIPKARQHLKPSGWLVMEIGFSIEGEVRALLSGWREIVVKPDLQGIPRVLAAANSPKKVM